MPPADPPGRFNELDALRTFAILVVIAFHVGGLAGGFAVDGGRPVELALLWFVTTASAFQLQVFFVMSGFFGALVVARSGPKTFARGRLERIGIPLVVGWLVMSPMLGALAVYGQDVRGQETEALDLGRLFAPELHHLWFLAYLLLYCAIAVGVLGLARRAPALRDAVERAFAAVVGTRWRLLVLVPATALVAYVAYDSMPLVTDRLRPLPWPFAYYGTFFLFGWLLYGRSELLPELRRAPVAHVAVALALSIAVVAVLDNSPVAGGLETTKAIVSGLTAVVTWCAVLGLLGLFDRWFSRPDPRVRYAADAAYWLYLAHLPLVVGLYYGLSDLGVPFFVKIVLVPVVAVGLMLLVYDRVVRHGAIGRVLHGHRNREGPRGGFEWAGR